MPFHIHSRHLLATGLVFIVSGFLLSRLLPLNDFARGFLVGIGIVLELFFLRWAARLRTPRC